MKKIIITGLMSVLTITTTSIYADRNHDYDTSFEDTARVIHVDPIYRTVQISTPQRECYRRPYHRTHYRQPESYTSTIAGGIIGGVIGNQFGKGDGKTAMTVAGTLLGGSIGRDMKYQSSDDDYDEYREQCQVSERYHEEQRIDGYQVTYAYHGRTYTTHMDHKPGRRIPVEVSVRPLADYY